MNTSKKSYTKTTFPDLMDNKKKIFILITALALLIGLSLLSLCVGAVNIPIATIIKIIFTRDVSSGLGQIFLYVRLPRTIAAILTGTALCISGTVLQTVLNNPMCSPGIIGVNAGAGLFMIITVAFFPAASFLASAAAFAGALFAVIIVWLLASKTGASKLAIVLAGIAVSSLLTAFTDIVITLVPDAKINRIDFLIGNLSGVTMANITFAFPYIIVGVLTVFILSFDINVLALGDRAASSLGLRTSLIRGILLITAAMLAGSAISLGGLIGFVGLIMPNVSKMLIGHDHRFLMPLSAILGAAFCLGCDILSRVLFAPFEIPVGIIMSLIGAPFFIYLILSKKRRAVFD